MTRSVVVLLVLWLAAPPAHRQYGAKDRPGPHSGRGLAHWSDGKEERLFLGTGDAYLLALDARTGKPCPDFGEKGRVDLTQGLHRKVDRKQYAVTSPPVICRGVVIVGSSINDMPSG